MNKALAHIRDTVILEGALPEIEKWHCRKDRAEIAGLLFLLAIIPAVVLSLRYELGMAALVLLVLGCLCGSLVSGFVRELSHRMIESHIDVLKEKLSP